MKKISTLIAMFLMALPMFVSCTTGGNEPIVDVKELVLTTSSTSIVADSVDAATLVVKLGEEVITSGLIFTVNDVQKPMTDNKFMTSEAGSFVIAASYNGQKSNKVTVSATAPVKPQFVNRSVVFHWCSTAAAPVIGIQKNYEKAQKQYGDQIMMLGLHGLKFIGTPKDPFGNIDNVNINTVETWLGGLGSYGVALINGTASQPFTANTATGAFYTTLNEWPFAGDLGLRIETSLEGRTLTAKVYFKNLNDNIADELKEMGGSLGLAVWLLEDGIMAPQMEENGTSVDFEYVHKDIVRYSPTLDGSLMNVRLCTPIKDYKEWMYEFTYEIPTVGSDLIDAEEFVLNNMKLQAHVMFHKGQMFDYVLNCREVKLGESQQDFEYVTK